MDHNIIQEEYFKQMKNSKIIVTCNPDNWEGDYRLFESLSCKCLVFSDKMITPVINNFIDKKHLIYYDRNNLELLKENLLYYLNNKDLIDEVSENGYLHALKYHKPEDRILEIINKINM
jgi:spore maturation protein CgeB